MNTPRYRRPELPPPEGLRRATEHLRDVNEALARKLDRAPAMPPIERIPGEHEIAREEIQRAGEFVQEEIAKLRDERGELSASLPEHVRNTIDVADTLIGGVVEFCKAQASPSPRSRRAGLHAIHEAIASLKRYQGDSR